MEMAMAMAMSSQGTGTRGAESLGPRKGLVVFSGGSAANSIVDVFNGLLTSSGAPGGEKEEVVSGSRARQKLSYIIGISDNGGSTSEILRVFGGPGIGDVRSRLIRLVPETEDDEVKVAIKQLLNYRLPASEIDAKLEWLNIVEGTHVKWKKISSDKRELLRSFLIFLNAEIVKRARPPTSTFNFHSASIGNLFLTGARIFFGSFESAIYLFSSITGVPKDVQVIPAINSNFAHHIAAGLMDRTVIVGQNQISHPTDTKAAPLLPNSENIYSTVPSGAVTPVTPTIFHALSPHTHSFPFHHVPHNHHHHPPLGGGNTPYQLDTDDEDDNDGVEDANLPGSHPSLRAQNIVFEKENEPELPSRVERIWYINPYGQEIRPPANPKVVKEIGEAEAVVYSIGSLYTSIIPCLILRGIGHALSSPLIPFKILILNGSLDRETGPRNASTPDFTASDFIRALVRACIDSQSRKLKPSPLTSLISTPNPSSNFNPIPPPPLIPPSEYQKYITHVVYLEGSGTPKVDIAELASWGIRAVRVDGKPKKGRKGMYYEVGNLRIALEGILGRR